MEILCAYVRMNAGPARPVPESIRLIHAKGLRTSESLIEGPALPMSLEFIAVEK